MAIHKPISAPQAPPAIGPYSPGVRVGEWIFLSGQLPIDVETKKIAGADITSQTHQVLKNIQALLEVTGASLGNVVKVTVYLNNLDDFKGMNDVFAQYFVVNPPARACVEVSRLPYNSLIEMDATAHHPRVVSGFESPGI